MVLAIFKMKLDVPIDNCNSKKSIGKTKVLTITWNNLELQYFWFGLLRIFKINLQLAKFSVGHSIPFKNFHGNIIQVFLSIKQKHVGFLTSLAKLDKMSVDFLTPLGSLGFLTPLGSVGFLTPLSSVGFLTPLGSVGFLTPFSCRPRLTFQPV